MDRDRGVFPGVEGDALSETGSRAGKLVSRRQALASAGGAAMVGALAAAPGAAADPGATAAGEVGHARVGETATRLVGVIDQKGGNFVAYGFYTLIAGLNPAHLFSAQTDPVSESKAFFTFHGTASLVQRTVVGDVFTLAVAGSLAHYYQHSPASDFADPASFASGVKIGTSEFAVQDVLIQLSSSSGLATLEGGVTQVGSQPFQFRGRTIHFGRAGLKTQLSASGLGAAKSLTPPLVRLSLSGTQVVAS
jgi:hypothetical protein